MKKLLHLAIALLFVLVTCKNEPGTDPIADFSGSLVYAGKTYKTITINGKEWMAENLAYLPAVSPASVASGTVSNYYVCGYTGTDVAAAKATANYTTYGVLYNWAAAKAACPHGWHLPSDEEWTTLTNFLGGESVAGGKLKETGTSHWNRPNNGATNETGFTALPGGDRYYNGGFDGVGWGGHWWSSTEVDTAYAWCRYVDYNSSNVYRSRYSKEGGFSVRCIRD